MYSLYVSIIGQGSVIPPGGDFAEGEVIGLTAYPAPGWTFFQWAGVDSPASFNPATVQMSNNKNVACYFTPESNPPNWGGILLAVGVIGLVSLTVIYAVTNKAKFKAVLEPQAAPAYVRAD